MINVSLLVAMEERTPVAFDQNDEEELAKIEAQKYDALKEAFEEMRENGKNLKKLYKLCLSLITEFPFSRDKIDEFNDLLTEIDSSELWTAAQKLVEIQCKINEGRRRW